VTTRRRPADQGGLSSDCAVISCHVMPATFGRNEIRIVRRVTERSVSAQVGATL
jgi:hypothetical protein